MAAIRVPRAALRDAAVALLLSRLVVWVAGLVAIGSFGVDPMAGDYDPAGLLTPFSPLGDALLAPAARWDSVWLLSVADSGYDTATRPAFFPLYPLLSATVGTPLGSLALGGLLVSLAAMYGALVVVHRLAALELGESRARTAVLALAFFPTSLFLSAIYSESLFLLCSAGAFLAARHDRWWIAGLLGGLAAATRSVGLLLLVPLLLLYLYGPVRLTALRLRPTRPIRPDVLALALIPLGLAAYLFYLELDTGQALSPFRAQEVWSREFVGPYLGVIDGLQAGIDGVRQLLSGARTPVYWEHAGGDPFDIAQRNLTDLTFFAVAVAAVVGALRTLPLAYGLWCLAALSLPLSYPVSAEPLMSMPRFVLVLFPLPLWLAARLGERPVARERVLACSAAGLALLSALFACWRWVA